MAAYAALVSVMQIIDQIEDHPHPPISLHKQQTESLTQIITFLQDFLEGYNPNLTYTAEADPLETRIAEAAYAAEDVIESYIVDQILARSMDHEEKMKKSFEFYQGLQKVIEEMDLIKMEVVEIDQHQHQLQISNAVADHAAGSNRTTQKVGMVGFDDVLDQMLEKITRGRAGLQIIPIVGMGGIGKTTLARNIYINPLVEEHFDVCAWSAISQQYNAQHILRQVLDQVGKKENRENLIMSEDELGEQLYKYLIGRRYFIVMDDMWSIDAWDRVRSFFPDNENGSRVVITTRLSNLASQFNCSNSLEMKFLDEASSWNLFSKTVFGEEIICPLELEDIGKKIVEGCKGLPLSIAVIGGLLTKTGRTRENWELIGENLNSIVNMEDNQSCLQILFMSYNNLPIYLKPCFLYMGVFSEDDVIPLFLLIPLWVAEGFLKPIPGKSLEEVAEEYLEELVDRNLLLVEKRNHYGKLKSCKMHDLLRDLSLREAQKGKFLCVLGEQSIPDIRRGINSQRRIARNLLEYEIPTPLFQSLESASLVRSLIEEFPEILSYNFRLLRLFLCQESSDEDKDILFGLVNLRLVFFIGDDKYSPGIPSSISFLWNLQAILYPGSDCIFDIWKMPQLRHVIGRFCLPDPPLSGDDNDMHMDEVVVLKNLQTLRSVTNFNFSEGVIKRIPNIKKLGLFYDETSRGSRGDHCLNNLSSLHNLESLRLSFSGRKKGLWTTNSNEGWSYLQSYSAFLLEKWEEEFDQVITCLNVVSFPYSLKELTLVRIGLCSDLTKIGSLPLLQVLKLKCISFRVHGWWITIEDQFSRLKFLKIDNCNLKYWVTDSYTHFPRLERLVLRDLQRLSKIPLCIGDIPTLRSIELFGCSDSAEDSAIRIAKEQEELGNEQLEVYC